ncbi:hypothetical protein BABINDRAFT_6628 [Babjeviella inositovora NRRL Y-12698]|uniref:Uncharacterized protein n=1 Tax=Babjeviella inositovora NRRL Y-12698 TaxID=984486 RepID=A0A1E3QWJ2_9ASCO|nr:uncharacterized protein BABINDRAFT_6628 [Babjeviella inositovora NRRL Y-12698]ODQ82010.1 hypothetical protein BABINDRAFT_6628 [Babjeviella inositovora NRRL Y-12698]
MNSGKLDIIYSTVFLAANDELRRGVRLDHRAMSEEQNVSLLVDKNTKYTSTGHAIAPDEVLEGVKTSNIKIPLLERADFAGAKLPDSDLLAALHYYIVNQLEVLPARYKNRFRKVFDETAMLALGVLVEEWADELITEDNARLFLEPSEEPGEKTTEEGSK